MARTARQRAALRKAQLASARKRKGRGKSKARKYARRAAIGYGIASALSAGGIYYLGTQINGKQKRRKNLAEALRGGATLPGVLAYAGAKAGVKKVARSRKKR